MFLAGTAAEVTAVPKFGLHRDTPGAITKTLMSEYDRLVLQSRGQIGRIVA
jgi:branched-chain amino acid aminotransferase